MAKAVKEAKASNKKESEDYIGDPVLEIEGTVSNKSSKKMTKEDAQRIVDNYRGINGVKIPELVEARKVLKETK